MSIKAEVTEIVVQALDSWLEEKGLTIVAKDDAKQESDPTKDVAEKPKPKTRKPRKTKAQKEAEEKAKLEPEVADGDDIPPEDDGFLDVGDDDAVDVSPEDFFKKILAFVTKNPTLKGEVAEACEKIASTKKIKEITDPSFIKEILSELAIS